MLALPAVKMVRMLSSRSITITGKVVSYSFFRRRPLKCGHQGVRELCGQRDAVVAAGRHGPSPVQRVRPLQPDQRSEPAAGAVGSKKNHPGMTKHTPPIPPLW